MVRYPQRGIIGIVGPCAAGKSTLIANLKDRGISARHIAQEHSYVADMWKRITNPEVLIFLDVSYEVSKRRRSLDWTFEDYTEERKRLIHALRHADYYLYTDDLSPQDVLQNVLCFLADSG